MRERINWDEVARKARFASDRDAIIKLYYQQAKSLRKTAETLGVSASALACRMDELNLPRRSVGGASYRLSGGPPCPHCGHYQSTINGGYYVNGNAFRRVRLCAKCEQRFLTTEKVKNGN